LLDDAERIRPRRQICVRRQTPFARILPVGIEIVEAVTRRTPASSQRLNQDAGRPILRRTSPHFAAIVRDVLGMLTVSCRLMLDG
jgi:hypothetical protein